MPNLTGLTPKRVRHAANWRMRRRAQQRELARVIKSLTDAINESGIIDFEFYQAQTGERLELEQDPARAWFDRPLPRPLLNPLAIPGTPVPGTPTDRSNPSSPLITYQDQLILYLKRVGDDEQFPFFDAQAYVRSHPDADSHPGRALGHFIANATDSTPIPVPEHWVGNKPLWGEWRAKMLDRAAQHRVERGEPEGPRLQTEWNAELEQQLVAASTVATIPRHDDHPTVSIVMPARNRAAIISEAIASVTSQTFDSWELLVIDDGSTDSTSQVVGELSESEPRIRLFEQEWGGAAVARNKGLANARGDYITFLDTDDQWTPDFLQVCVAALQSPGTECVYAGVHLKRDDAEFYRAFSGDFRHLLKQNFITMSTLMLNRELLKRTGGFDDRLKRWIDYDFVLRIFQNTEPKMVPVIGLLHDDQLTRSDRITTSEPDYWEYIVRSKYLLDWNEIRTTISERVAGRVSVVIPTFFDWQMTVDAVRAVLRHYGDADIEVVIVENSANRHASLLLDGFFCLNLSVKVVHTLTPLGFALGSNYGFAHSTGEYVLFLNNDTTVRAGSLTPLVAALNDPGVSAAQPLLVYPDSTIQTAGTVFPKRGMPSHLLAHHPQEDATKIGPISLSVGSAAALLMRASDVAEFEGFDPRYINGWEDVDLCLRLLTTRPQGVVVATDSVVTHHESKTPGRGRYVGLNRKTFVERWRDRLPPSDLEEFYAAAGFRVDRFDSGTPMPVGGQRAPAPVLTRSPESKTNSDGTPRLRWAIKIAAPAGPRGDHWGDVFFANDVAAALRGLGQEVVIDRRDAHNRATTGLDDVVLVIRGLDPYSPQPEAVNILWVISHPDEVTVAEIDSYDAAFAASVSWSRQMTEQTRVPVATLLQATNPDRFHLHPGHDRNQEALFVGSSRNQDRPIVSDALGVGLPIAIHGGGWEGRVPTSVIRSDFLANDELSLAYGQAGVVLCDHWADMAANGFISNRLFDAVASGASVVTDPVLGIADVFGEEVFEYRSPDELESAACSRIERAASPEIAAQASERIRTEHSFAVRAQALLDTALALRA